MNNNKYTTISLKKETVKRLRTSFPTLVGSDAKVSLLLDMIDDMHKGV